jgi:sorting nexin-1/2
VRSNGLEIGVEHLFGLAGRFEDQFIEARRAALEKCLNKMANHPVLSLDPDLRLFLESESFEFEVSSRFLFLCANADSLGQVKHRKHETAQSQESKGLLATIGGSIGGPRFVEKDDVSMRHLNPHSF